MAIPGRRSLLQLKKEARNCLCSSIKMNIFIMVLEKREREKVGEGWNSKRSVGEGKRDRENKRKREDERKKQRV